MPSSTGFSLRALAMSLSDVAEMGLPEYALLTVALLKRDALARSEAVQPRIAASCRKTSGLTRVLIAALRQRLADHPFRAQPQSERPRNPGCCIDGPSRRTCPTQP
jgi:hypothetical protein